MYHDDASSNYIGKRARYVITLPGPHQNFKLLSRDKGLLRAHSQQKRMSGGEFNTHSHYVAMD